MTDDEKKDPPEHMSRYTWTLGPGATISTSNNGTLITYNPPEPARLFGNWIEKTKYLQEEFYGQKFEDFTQKDLERWMMVNGYAAEDEIHEATDEISWKPWASAEFFNREAFIGEIVDVLHFIGNMLAAAQCTDEELNAAYLEKMERNRQRQREGYTGTDKCAGCRRAIDDIIAHGGRVVAGEQDGCNESTLWCNTCIVERGL